MFTQSKKGFTLIELMVVIVIIGILAAIAIPKLFGMSAKAKAQEVGPAASSWAKLMQAYKMETSHYGDAATIGYKIPGADNETKDEEGSTGNFKYEVTGDEDVGDFKADSKFSAENCAEGVQWKAAFTATTGDDPEVDIIITGAKSGVTTTVGGCKALTPNYCNMGAKTGNCTASGSGGGASSP